MLTNWYLLLRYDENQESAAPVIPKRVESLFNKILWSTVSKAADKSKSLKSGSSWKQAGKYNLKEG